MSKGIWRSVLACAVACLLATPALAQEGSLYVGNGSLAAITQSKPWFHEGSWFAVLMDGADHYIHRLDGDTFVELPDGFVDSRNSAQADVLAVGSDLFVLMGHSTESRVYKFTYAAATHSYTLVAGFPVIVPLGSGWDAATIAVDSTGQAWIAHQTGTDIHVMWSTSATHDTWDTTGLTLATGTYAGDRAVVTAVGSTVGVMWSDQVGGLYGYRSHVDGDPAGTWSTTEIVSDLPYIADNHINLATTPDDVLIAATKDVTGAVNIFVRDPVTGWNGPHLLDVDGTRPAVAYNSDNGYIYCFYSSPGTSPTRIRYKSIPLTDVAMLSDVAPADFLSIDGVALNDVTTTKQAVTNASGLLALAKGGDTAYYRVLDFTAPIARILATPSVVVAPADVQFIADASDPDGTIVSYAWDFDDGSTSTEANPSHTFSTAGIYTVMLAVTDNDGKTTHTSLDLLVGSQPPFETAAINFQPASAPVPAGYAVATGAGFDPLLGYGWDRALAAVDRETNADQRLDTYVEVDNSEVPAEWSYALPPGLYSVSLTAGSPAFTAQHLVKIEGVTVIDNVATAHGEFVDVTDYQVEVLDGALTVTIGGGSDLARKTKISYLTLSLVEARTAPTATAGASVTEGAAQLAVSFTGSATDDDGTIASWLWDFDDGETSTAQSPAHTFIDPGTFNITLEVTDNDGLTDIATLTITVTEPAPDTGTTGGGTTGDGTAGDGTAGDGTTGDGTTGDGTTGDGTTADSTGDDGTTADGTTDDGTTDEQDWCEMNRKLRHLMRSRHFRHRARKLAKCLARARKCADKGDRENCRRYLDKFQDEVKHCHLSRSTRRSFLRHSSRCKDRRR